MMLAHKTRRALYLAIAGVLVAGTVCAGFNFGMTGAVKNKGKKLERKAKEEAERRRLAPAPKRDLFIADFFNSSIRKVNAAGIITTVAGNGTAGFSGDGGPATAAQLDGPGGVAVDGSGNLFIADLADSRVRKVDVTGMITTVAGDGTPGFSGDGGSATAAQLAFPFDVAIDSLGNLYIADSNNHRIRMVNAAGIITTVAGDGTFGFSGDGGPATTAQLNTPVGIAK